jgi:hypothetical protein
LSKLMSKVMFYVGKVQVGYYYIITRINFRWSLKVIKWKYKNKAE